MLCMPPTHYSEGSHRIGKSTCSGSGACFWHVTYTQFSGVVHAIFYVTTIVVVMCGWWYIINKNMLGIFNLAAAFDWIELTSRTEQGADRMIVSLFKFQPSSHECKATTTQTRTKSRSSGWLIWISSRTLLLLQISLSWLKLTAGFRADQDQHQ